MVKVLFVFVAIIVLRGAVTRQASCSLFVNYILIINIF